MITKTNKRHLRALCSIHYSLFFSVALCAVLCLAFTACEKVVISDEEKAENEDGLVEVTLRVSDVELMSGTAGTRTLTSIADVSKRLNFLVYQNGSKVKTVNQKAEDSGFGTVSLSLTPGTYQLLVLAHNCPANPTTATPEKVQFNNTETGYTDTFYYYGDLTVDAENQETELSLKRAVSLFRLTINDAKPAQVTKLRLYYSGGSCALNAVTGYGCVNSKQTVWYDLSTTTASPIQCDAYTFLHDETGTLKVTATAYSASDEVLYEHVFTDVSMERNHIKEYSGNFFVNGEEPIENPDTPDNPENPQTDTARGIVIMADPAWAGTSTVNY